MIQRDSILIVEDEENVASLIEKSFRRAGFHTIIAHDGERALHLARECEPSFVVLDLMLPKMNGWDVCKLLREESDVPILMLSAREEEVDKLFGFSLGADDYVVKPFSPRELIERVKAILRRTKSAPVCKKTKLTFGNLLLEPEKHKLTRKGEPVWLTPSEYVLLLTLMSTPGRVFTRHELLGKLYQTSDAVVARVVDVHIGKLRQKIECDPANPHLILTVRGVGYRFAENEELGGS
ncbi:MAG: response regulator transcription factor [Nitrospinae bacterium]|nr:response regulator transcription factor [Nitrospinota bacterium]